MQELQNWFRIFCTSNSLQFTLWPSQPVAEPIRGLRVQSCELKTARGTKNLKPVLKFLHIKYSFLRVSPKSEIQCPPLADIDARNSDRYQETPLELALNSGNKEIIETLVSKGAKLNLQDWHGDFPIHNAVSYHNMEIVSLLIKHGTEINVEEWCKY